MLANIFAKRIHQASPLTITKFIRMNGEAGVLARNKSSSSSDANKQTTSSSDGLSNEPVKFFGSDAANWRAKDSRSGGADQVLWYQPYVVSGSLAVFLIYFCMLREESDIDRKLEGNLFDHVQGLEELQLTVSYKYNKENGLDTRDLEKRLAELGIDVKKLELSPGH